MIDRAEALALVRAIRDHADIMADFLADPTIGGRPLELELLGRANLLEARLAKLRATVNARVPSRRPELHVLGDKPEGTPAA